MSGTLRSIGICVPVLLAICGCAKKKLPAPIINPNQVKTIALPGERDDPNPFIIKDADVIRRCVNEINDASIYQSSWPTARAGPSVELRDEAGNPVITITVGSEGIEFIKCAGKEWISTESNDVPFLRRLDGYRLLIYSFKQLQNLSTKGQWTPEDSQNCGRALRMIEMTLPSLELHLRGPQGPEDLRKKLESSPPITLKDIDHIDIE